MSYLFWQDPEAQEEYFEGFDNRRTRSTRILHSHAVRRRTPRRSLPNTRRSPVCPVILERSDTWGYTYRNFFPASHPARMAWASRTYFPPPRTEWNHNPWDHARDPIHILASGLEAVQAVREAMARMSSTRETLYYASTADPNGMITRNDILQFTIEVVVARRIALRVVQAAIDQAG